MPRPAQLQVGDTVSDCYRILAKIGEGGMGVVYKVQQTSMHRTCALKTIEAHGDETSKQAIWHRFQQEAQTISKLEHKSVIKVYDFGITDSGTAYYVMDFVEGKTLLEVMRKQGQLDMRQALAIFIQVAQGLAYAHTQRVVHLDVKPSNIMLVENPGGTPDQEVRIIDFGLAEKSGRGGNTGGGSAGGGSAGGGSDVSTGDQRQEGAGSELRVIGSPPYMSPEQFQNGAVDFRSDIYSFGCALFEALTGVPPFIADSALVLSMKHVSESPPTLKQASLGSEFPAELEMIEARLLAKDPSERYQDMSVVAEDLEGVLASLPQNIQGSRTTRSAAPWSEIGIGRGRGKVTGAGALADSQNITLSPLPQAKLMRTLIFAGGFLLFFACVALAVSITFQGKPHSKVAAPQAAPPADKAVALVKPTPSATTPDTTAKSASSALSDSTSPSISSAAQTPSDLSNSTAAATSTAKETISPDSIFPVGIGKDSKEPFSKLEVGKNGRKMRVFYFPENIILGRFVERDMPPNLGYVAKGRVAFEIERKLQFVSSAICCQSPSYFRRFRQDDLCELDLTKNETVTSETLNYIDHLTSLERLRLIDTEIDNDCIPAIDHLTALDWLDVSNTNMTGKGVAKLKRLRQLHGLRFAQLLDTSPILTALKGCDNIHDLHADGTTLTPNDLQIIAGLKQLNFLSINATRIGLHGLDTLSQSPSLESLMITTNGFGPNVIPILKKFPKLKQLKINCDNWPKAQVYALRAALPKVELNIAEPVND